MGGLLSFVDIGFGFGVSFVAELCFFSVLKEQ